jgi:hypothetical protein
MNAAAITVVDPQLASQICFLLNTFQAHHAEEQRTRLLDKLEEYGIDDPRTPELVGALAAYWQAVIEAPLKSEVVAHA